MTRIKRKTPSAAKFNSNPQVSRVLNSLEKTVGFQLPKDYAEFLRHANGGEGFVGPDYIILWPVEDLLDLNQAYQVGDYAPGLFLFGSNGGGEALAFDLRVETTPVVSVPFVGMELNLVQTVPGFRFPKINEMASGPVTPAHEEKNRPPQAYDGKEIFEIQPIILGGHPTDPANKFVLTREEHIQAVRFWNKVIAQERRKNVAAEQSRE